MANLKVTYLYNWGARGWSETYYRQGELPTVDKLGNVNGAEKITKLFKLRCALLCGASTADPNADVARPVPVGYRVTNLDTKKAIPLNAPGDVRAVNAKSTKTGDRGNFAFATATLANGSKRTIRFKGIPEEWVVGDISQKKGVVPGSMSAPFLAFTQALLEDNWQARVQAVGNSRDIVGIGTDNDGNYVLILDPGLSFTQNERILIQGVRGLGTRGINGTARVIKVAVDGTLTIARKKCDRCQIDPKNFGRVVKLANPSFTLSNIVAACFSGWGSGLIGSGFSGDGGRRNCCR